MKEGPGKYIDIRIDTDDPLVAMETAVFTHGLPEEESMKVMSGMMNSVKENGATPCPIGMLDGEIIVGMSPEELRILKSSNPVKLTSRDIPFSVAKKGSGGFTVSATLLVCGKLGIDVMVTGGIGGVHRFPKSGWDVSSDLMELSRNDVIVVCSGPKSVLDIDLTYEMLETFGIPVMVYGSDELPAFHLRKTGLRASNRFESIDEIVESISVMRYLNMRSSLLVLNPISRSSALKREYIDELLDTMDRSKIPVGKEVTPYLLEEIANLSDGSTIGANIELLIHNSRLAASIAMKM